MKSHIYAIMAIILVLVLLPATASAETDLSTIESAIVGIRADILGGIDAWTAAAEEVEAAQAERAEFETYQEAYDLLMQTKADVEAWEGRLFTCLNDVMQYQADHPDLTPSEQELIGTITDGVDAVSVLVDGFLMRVSAIEVAQAALAAEAAPAEREVQPELRSTGDVSVLTGDGTYTDYDRQFVSLTQYYKDREERYFTFSEKYDDDHSFRNLRRWEFGMSQEFPDVFSGKLNLRERFRDYKDLDVRTNSRRELALHLDYEQLLNADRSLVDFTWDYKSRNYSALSTRSYLHHFVELYALHPLCENTTADAFWKMTDYHFSQGDNFGYNMTNLGAGLEFVPGVAWLWGVDYVSTEKSYDVLKTQAYFENDYKFWTRYQPDARSFGESELRLRDRDRRQSTVNDYDETRLKLRYWRELDNDLDGDFKFEWRQKDFSGVNASSYDFWRWQMAFNYYPTCNTRWYYNFDFNDYDFTGITRSYDRMYHRVGLNYNWDNGTSLSAALAYTDQNYSANTGRDYAIWDFLADLYYPFERNRDVRVYFDWSSLSQSMANSVNDYTSYGWGIEYNWRVGPHHRLTFAYDYDLRDYENQPRIKDQVFEARLRFDY